MNNYTAAAPASSRLHALVSALLVIALALGTLTLVGCGSSDEQDNCYGEDMPVVNEE